MNRTRLIEYAKTLYEEDQRIYGLSRPFNRLSRRIRKEWKDAAATVVEAARQKQIRDMGEVFAYTLAAF